jgi:hypothetical protein
MPHFGLTAFHLLVCTDPYTGLWSSIKPTQQNHTNKPHQVVPDLYK